MAAILQEAGDGEGGSKLTFMGMNMKLADICEINPKAESLDDNMLVSFVSMPDVSEDGQINVNTFRPYKEVKKGFTCFKEGDILFAKITPCMENGKGALAIGLKNGIGYGSTEFHVLRPNKEIVVGKWLYYLTAWPVFRLEAERHMTGSAGQKRVSKSFLEKYDLKIPPINTQERQVSQLDRVRSIINLRQQQLSALDDLIKARFVEMFGECRESISAGDLMNNMRNGVSPSTSGKHQEKVLTLSAITQGQFDPNMWKDGIFDAIPAADKRICSTDFYMCRGNGNKSLVGAGVYSADDRDDLVFPDTVIAASVDTTRVCLPYLFVAWMQPGIREQIEAGARTTNGTYKINQQIISKIKVPLPPLPEQQQFATFVAQIDKSKSVIQKSLDETQLLFDSLMQEYFG